jgi:hypothetical protein
MSQYRAFRGGYRIRRKDREEVVSLPVVEKLFRLMEEGNSPRHVARATKLQRSDVEGIYYDLLRLYDRDYRERHPYPSGVISSQLIGDAHGSNVGPNNDYLLPREGSWEAERIDAELNARSL